MKSVDIPPELGKSYFEFDKEIMLESPLTVKCTLCDEILEASFDKNGLFDLDYIEDHIELHEDDCEESDSNKKEENSCITYKSEIFS
jgi:hypothetical protein